MQTTLKKNRSVVCIITESFLIIDRSRHTFLSFYCFWKLKGTERQSEKSKERFMELLAAPFVATRAFSGRVMYLRMSSTSVSLNVRREARQICQGMLVFMYKLYNHWIFALFHTVTYGDTIRLKIWTEQCPSDWSLLIIYFHVPSWVMRFTSGSVIVSIQIAHIL